MTIFKVSSQAKVQQPLLLTPWEKSAASAAIPSPIVPASVSSWTRAAYEDLDAADEPAELEDDAEPLIEEEEDPSGSSVAPSASGRPLFLAPDLAPLCVETPAWGFREEKEGEEEEEEEEEEVDASDLLSLSVCPRSSSTAAVARFWFSL